MRQHIQFINGILQEIRFTFKNAIDRLGLDLKFSLSEIELIVFIFLIYISKQHHVGWSGIGTFSVREGCQWVKEPVSRHFFINQIDVKDLIFI